jgi:small subunit ribosomal protein S13
MADIKQASADYRHIVRIVDTDLDGSKPVFHALNKIKGVSFMFSHAICAVSGVDTKKKAGALNPSEISKLEGVIRDPMKYGIPLWIFNRRNDVETGVDKHVIGADLRWQVENDIKLMKKIRCYKGVRHMIGQPVRGQSTKSNFRNKKGKASLGVTRKAAAPSAKPAAPAKDAKKK